MKKKKRSHTDEEEEEEEVPIVRPWLAPLTATFIWKHHTSGTQRRGLPGQRPVKTIVFGITEPLEKRLLELHFNRILVRPHRSELRDIPDERGVYSASSDSLLSDDDEEDGPGGMESSASEEGVELAETAPLDREEVAELRRRSRVELITQHSVGGFLVFSVYERVPPFLDALDAARLHFLATDDVEPVLAVMLWAMGEEDNYAAFPLLLRETPYRRCQQHLGGARVPYSIRLHTVDEGKLCEDDCMFLMTLASK